MKFSVLLLGDKIRAKIIFMHVALLLLAPINGDNSLFEVDLMPFCKFDCSYDISQLFSSFLEFIIPCIVQSRVPSKRSSS